MGSIGGASSRPHVAVLAFPFGTHAAPLYALASRLAAASPAALFSFFGTAKSNVPLGAAAGPQLPNLRLHEVPDGSPEGFAPPPGNPELEVDLFLRITPGNFMEGLAEAVRGSGGAAVSCIVSDCFLWFAGDLAEELGVPWVPLWTGGPCSLQAHVSTDEIRRIVGVTDPQQDRSLEFVPGLSAFRVRDLPEGVVFGNLDSLFARLLHRMGLELPKATAVALNTFEGLEPEVTADLKSKFKKCYSIGPVNLLTPPSAKPLSEDDSGCLPWLDGQAPSSVAYIAFGSVMTPPPPELAALAEGVEASGAPFIWSLKEKAWGLLPEGFLERTKGRGMVVPWAPQVDVLGHGAVGVFMTHCGWNSVTESITAGVPMICRPFFGDQRLNAREVSGVWEAGVIVEGGVLTREGVVGALKAVLGMEEGKRMRESAVAVKELALKAVGKGGSSVEDLEALVQLVCRGCA